MGGSVDEAKREADCKYVIARRKSPPETAIREFMAAGDMVIFSVLAMCCRRNDVEEVSRGLKRNLEQREASGSIILKKI